MGRQKKRSLRFFFHFAIVGCFSLRLSTNVKTYLAYFILFSFFFLSIHDDMHMMARSGVFYGVTVDTERKIVLLLIRGPSVIEAGISIWACCDTK